METSAHATVLCAVATIRRAALLTRIIQAEVWWKLERERALLNILRLGRVPKDRQHSRRYEKYLSEKMGCPIFTSHSIDYEIYKVVERTLFEGALFDHRIRSLKSDDTDKRKRLRHIARLIREFNEEYANDETFNTYLDIFSCSGSDLTLFASRNEMSFECVITGAAEGAAQFLSPKPKKAVTHRPPGSIKNPVLRRLVLDLYRILEEAGGELTLRKDADGEIRGTLPAVLEILRPLLPNVIPVQLPYETLRDLRKQARERNWSNKSTRAE